MTFAFRTARAVVLPFVVFGVLAFGCFSGSPAALLEDQDAAPPSLGLDDEGGPGRRDADLGDPFAIDGLSPSHGPFTGGTRTRISGRGFSSKVHVYVGGTEVPPESFLASDPTRAAIVTPPGPPGFVDVKIRDDATAQERVLKNGFFYDSFVVQPDTGATSGGTRIALTGSGTTWAAGTKVTIGGQDCADVVIKSATRLECVTPAGTPGAKDVVATTLGGQSLQARDAFTYSDSNDGYRGGLGGGAFSGRIKVLAFDGYIGTPIPAAYAIAGSTLATAKVKKTNTAGVVEIDGLPTDTGKVTVTVAAECHQPITFVDVPVDTVTVYMPPVFDITCAKGDPPSTGGRGGKFGGIIEGQLIFPGAGEFKKVGWTTVPTPTRPTERRAAYVFEAFGSPTPVFQLPAASEAITPDSPGVSGYEYATVVYPGNATIYVVAGIEDRSESPVKFVPYAMGVAKGVNVPAQAKVQGVDIKMDVLFDHQVTIEPTPPYNPCEGKTCGASCTRCAPNQSGCVEPPGAKVCQANGACTTRAPSCGLGMNLRLPDRLQTQVAVTLGAAGFAILPRGTRVSPLPLSDPKQVPFIGVPSLDKALTKEQYVLGGAAATGPDLQRPASIVSRIRTTNANTPVMIGGFLGVPILEEPANGTWSGRHVEFNGATGPVDLSVTEVTSGNGLVEWTIVAPGGVSSFDIPDIAAICCLNGTQATACGASCVGTEIPEKGKLGLVRGGIQTTVHVARIDGFEYGRLRYGHLSAGGWSAYAFDSLSGVY